MSDPTAQPPADSESGATEQPDSAPGRPYTVSGQPASTPPQPSSTPPQPTGASAQPYGASQPPPGAPAQPSGAWQSPYPPAPPPPGQNPYAAPATQEPFTAEQDKQTAMFAHLGGVVSFLAFFTGWLSLLAIVPALVIYLAFRRRGRLTAQESKEALNFQITMVGSMIIWAIIATIATLAVTFANMYGAVLLVLLLLAVVGWALVIIDVVFSIVAAVRVNNGGAYRYPFAVRFIK